MNALCSARSFHRSTFARRAIALGALGVAIFAVAAPAQAGHRGGFSFRFSTPRETCAPPAPRFGWKPACNDGPARCAWGSWEHGQLTGLEHGEWQGYRDGLEGRMFCDARRLPLHQYSRAFIEGYERAHDRAYDKAYKRGQRDRRSHCR